MKVSLPIIVCFLLVGCSPSVIVDQDYFISSVLKNKCLVSTYLRIYHYNYPFDIITEQSDTEIVSCDDVKNEMTKQYQKVGDNKIKLENKFK